MRTRIATEWDRWIFAPLASWLWWHVTAESREQARKEGLIP